MGTLTRSPRHASAKRPAGLREFSDQTQIRSFLDPDIQTGCTYVRVHGHDVRVKCLLSSSLVAVLAALIASLSLGNGVSATSSAMSDRPRLGVMANHASRGASVDTTSYVTSGTPVSNFAPSLVFSTFLGTSYRNGLATQTVLPDRSFLVLGDYRVDSPGMPVPMTIGPYDLSGSYFARFHPDGSPDFVTYLGVTSGPVLSELELGRDGTIYLFGQTMSQDFPVVNPPEGSSPPSAHRAFVVKLSPDGRQIVFSALLGPVATSAFVRGHVADDGSIYMSGNTDSEDFPQIGGEPHPFGGLEDGFVAKIASDGSRIEYCVLIGGSGQEAVEDLAVDSNGRAIVTGWTRDGAGFPLVLPAEPVSGDRRSDAFVVALSASTGIIESSSLLGDSRDERAYGICIGDDGDAYITGYGSAGYPTRNAYQREPSPGSEDAVVTRLHFSATSTDIVYSSFLGGHEIDVGVRIALGSDGSIHVLGRTLSPDFPEAKPLRGHGSNPAGVYEEIFLTRFAPDGRHLSYSAVFGGSNHDYGQSLVLDAVDCAYIGGATDSKDFPTRRAVRPVFGDVVTAAILLKVSPFAAPTVRAIRALERPGKPFRIKLTGSDFIPGARVYIGDDPSPWTPTVVKSGSTVILKGGESLAERFPTGTTVFVRISNPDGGEDFAAITR